MASQKLCSQYPPFPEDVATASIAKISLAKLAVYDKAEALQMFKACRNLGFFLLDLDNEAGKSLVGDIEQVFSAAEAVFDLPYEEKSIYNMIPPHRLVGYKAEGVMKTETGQPDKCEFFTVSRDDMLGYEPIGENPPVIHDNRSNFVSYLKHINPIVQVLLTTLDKQLGLPEGRLSSLQRVDQPSGTVIRMIRYPAQAADDRRTALLPHTDYGTLTLLATPLGGLQILPREVTGDAESKWRYVRPEPGCVVVNVGDAFVEWTGGVLRSNLHRATFGPGLQGDCIRHSIAYLIRPERNVSMRRLTGGRIPVLEDGDAALDLTASEWEMKKAMALKAGSDIAQSRGGAALKDLLDV